MTWFALKHAISEDWHMTAVAPAFIAQSRRLLSEPYLPRIARCPQRFSADQIWERANPACKSVGNLMLHLAGNVRQWVISGLGMAADRRQRPQEVDARGPIPRAELLHGLQRTVAEADVVLVSICPHRLPERRQIQGCDVAVLEASTRCSTSRCRMVKLRKPEGRSWSFHLLC
jgi:hypothetical protein